MQAAEQTARSELSEGLAHLPVGVFATVMGAAGLTLATERMAHDLALLAPIAVSLLVLTALLYAALLGIYAVKFVRHRDAVRAEWHHPVRISFFPPSPSVCSWWQPRLPRTHRPLPSRCGF